MVENIQKPCSQAFSLVVEKLPCALEQSDGVGGGGVYYPLTLSGRYYIGMFPHRGGKTFVIRLKLLITSCLNTL